MDDDPGLSALRVDPNPVRETMRLDGPELVVDRLSRPRRQELRRKGESREAERNAEVPEPIGQEPEIR